MAFDGKRGFFSSLFGTRRQKEQEETALAEARQRLEERIQQILAQRVDVPELITQEDYPTLPAREEVEAEIELFPITASVFNHKGPIPASFLPESIEASRFHATADRW